MRSAWNVEVVGNEDSLINDIIYSKNLYECQVGIVNKEKYIKQLLLEDYVMKIKCYETRYDMFPMFKEAQKQINNKLEKDRPQFELLKRLIMEDFLDNDQNFKLTNIIAYGYEEYVWEVEFEGYGTTFRIEIPIKSRITPDNVEDACYGMICFSVKESEYRWSVKKASYKISDISDFIKEYFGLNKEVKEEF